MSEDQPWMSKDELEARIRSDPVAMGRLHDDLERENEQLITMVERATELAKHARGCSTPGITGHAGSASTRSLPSLWRNPPTTTTGLDTPRFPSLD
jgi:hypothetical protein